MHKDLISYLNNNHASFSKGQKVIADYIINNYDKAAFMTALKLGKTVGVSESTVVRFASILGFEGYPGLQYALQELIKNKLTATQRLEVAKQHFGDNILEKVINADIYNMRRTLEETSKEEFARAVELIANAERIFILGSRGASSLANFLSYYLNLSLPNVNLIQTTSTSEMLEQIMRINENDVLIGISFPRYSKKTVKAFDFAYEKGANIIALTDSESSPLAAVANVLLLARSNMVGYVDSLIAPLSLVNALIVAVSLKNFDSVSLTLAKLENIWDRYDIYEKVGEINLNG